MSGLGTRTSSLVAISGSPATVTIKMELSAASRAAVARLHLLADLSFGTTFGTTLWTAGVSYPYASVEL
jgi:hypothetical protein